MYLFISGHWQHLHHRSDLKEMKESGEGGDGGTGENEFIIMNYPQIFLSAYPIYIDIDSLTHYGA